jgi:hypothetical protein
MTLTLVKYVILAKMEIFFAKRLQPFRKNIPLMRALTNDRVLTLVFLGIYHSSKSDADTFFADLRMMMEDALNSRYPLFPSNSNSFET